MLAIQDSEAADPARNIAGRRLLLQQQPAADCCRGWQDKSRCWARQEITWPQLMDAILFLFGRMWEVGLVARQNAFVSIEVLNLLSTERDARVRWYSCLILRYFNVFFCRRFTHDKRRQPSDGDASVPSHLNRSRLFLVTYLSEFCYLS